MTPLHDLPATELLAAYRSKALSPVEVTRSVLAHMHKWEPHLHATWALEGDEALAQAEASQMRWLKGAPQGALDQRKGQRKKGKKGSGLPFLLHSVRTRLLLCRYQPTDM